MKNTKLWHITMHYGSPIRIYVSDKAGRLPSCRRLSIRSITARAAARRYIRNNLWADIAKMDIEYGNPFSRSVELDEHKDYKDFKRMMSRCKTENVKIIKV